MAQLTPKGQDHAVAFAAATLFCELLTQRLLTRQTEMVSEALAWVLLPLLVRAGQRRGQGEMAPPAAANTTTSGGGFGVVLFAAGISVASFCKAENGTSRFYVSSSPDQMQSALVILTTLQPALVPILLAAQRYMQLDLADTTRGNSGSASPIFTSVSAASIIAAIAVLDLFMWNLEKLLYASVALLSVSLAYMTLLPQQRRKAVLVPPIRIEENVVQLSKYVVLGVAFVFVIQTLVFGLTTGSLLRTLATAVFKCLTWFFAIQLVRRPSTYWLLFC